MALVTIDAERCHQDGICAAVCPTKFIKGKPGELPRTREGIAHCIACGHCMAFCPHDAVRVAALPHDGLELVNKKALPSPESVAHLCKSRRSIRVFKETPVPRETVQHILDTAAYAPTAKNLRNFRQIMLYDRAQIVAFGECLVECLAEDMKAASPVFSDARGLIEGWKAGKDPIFRNAPHLLLAVSPKDWAWAGEDPAIHLTYFELAAYAHGVGACWAGYVTRALLHFPQAQAFFGIAEDEVIAGGQMFGYSRYAAKAIPPRPPFPITWF